MERPALAHRAPLARLPEVNGGTTTSAVTQMNGDKLKL